MANSGNPASLHAEPPDYSKSSWSHYAPNFSIGLKILALSPWRIKPFGPFNLAVAPGVRHRGIVDVDAAFLAAIPELGARE